MAQAYSRLSTTHGHITDCKLDSVVYAGVVQGRVRCIFLQSGRKVINCGEVGRVIICTEGSSPKLCTGGARKSQI